MKTIAIRYIIGWLTVCMIGSCGEFLDEPTNKKLVVPKTLQDLQALLDDYNNLRIDPAWGEISSDDYFLTDADWSGLTNEGHRRTYLWASDYLYGAGASNDWLYTYRGVYWANIVLEEIDKIDRTDFNHADWDNVQGQAFFLRGRSFLNAINLWTEGYDLSTASDKLGIPLRLNSDINIKSERKSLHACYAQVNEDLRSALSSLPNTPVHVLRASKAAALGLLARMSLFTHNYEEGLTNAEQCLAIKNSLLDYNQLEDDVTFPFEQFNSEVIYASVLGSPAPLNIERAKIDSVLIKSYGEYDRRRTLFFRGNADSTYAFRGSYEGSNTLFSGIATDEIYLILAECYARLNSLNQAREVMEEFGKHRYVQEPFTASTFATQDVAINYILEERRKQLLMRSLRWPDVKRLNIIGADISMSRVVNGQVYLLPANDLRFALPIPEDVIEMTGMQPNPR